MFIFSRRYGIGGTYEHLCSSSGFGVDVVVGVAAWGFDVTGWLGQIAGWVRVVERITRPLGHDMDEPLTEPPLTDDELVAVRGLIQERYKDSVAADFPAGVESPTPPVGIPLATDMANRAIRYTYADFARKPPQ
jgi:hypothetical protein